MSRVTSHAPTVTVRPRHLILDRDGVLNREAPDGGYVTSAAAWHWMPGALEALALMTQAKLMISVATNQSGVGRGLMTQADLDAVHARMVREAELAGARIHGIYFCPHAPEAGCSCRKPAPGLIEQALAASGVPAAETLVVGDDLRDLQAAEAAGVPAALVLTGKGRRAAQQLGSKAVPIFQDLRALSLALVSKQEPTMGSGT
jgi:D-glycero-D-manno-heptose 1,7-bisphosphate phosphatase